MAVSEKKKVVGMHIDKNLHTAVVEICKTDTPAMGFSELVGNLVLQYYEFKKKFPNENYLRTVDKLLWKYEQEAEINKGESDE